MTGWKYKNYSKEEFIQAWESSSKYLEILSKLGYRASGSNIKTIKKISDELGLSRENISKGRNKATFLTLEEILINPSSFKGSPKNLRKKLLKAGLKENSCEKCKNSEWEGLPIPLDLDHIDGDPKNNLLSNLRVLCPNCHRQTETWGIGKDRLDKKLRYNSLDCSNRIHKRNTYCSQCVLKHRKEKQEYPVTSVLIEGVETFGYRKYSQTIGLSDNGLRKLLTRRGVERLPKRVI